MTILSRALVAAIAAAAVWTAAAVATTWTALPALRTDFYSSIPRDQVGTFQRRVGVMTSAGADWIHAGWIADPERESYRVSLRSGDEAWSPVTTTRYGSALVGDLRAGSDYEVRVEAVAEAAGAAARELGTATVRTTVEPGPLERPVIAGPWRRLFRPSKAGNYVNDHTVFRDASGRWRVLGITGPGRGDYNAELRLAQGLAPDRAAPLAAQVPGGATSPPAPLTLRELLAAGGMTEDEPVADFRRPAWAPHVIREHGGLFHLYWSPHRLAHAVSIDGAHWYRRPDAIALPSGWFFRDAMLLEVARGQWLLYATARGWWYSRVDLYQSFDLDHWQHIGVAWQGQSGSERNALVSSAESPFVVARGGRYYLSITYNNETGIAAPLALALGYWTGGARAYNDTLVFASGDPYEFGTWRGRGRASGLVAELEAHAPEIVRDDADDAWYVTTCGWPLAATLTSGEVAAAPLRWEPVTR
ncbi:MAG: hypothetical protein HY899_06060 [Deltaproteobacteria bacterium]|nr:hypothetical protein [Deltaproteobacteria bacterium]